MLGGLDLKGLVFAGLEDATCTNYSYLTQNPTYYITEPQDPLSSQFFRV